MYTRSLTEPVVEHKNGLLTRLTVKAPRTMSDFTNYNQNIKFLDKAEVAAIAVEWEDE